MRRNTAPSAIVYALNSFPFETQRFVDVLGPTTKHRLTNSNKDSNTLCVAIIIYPKKFVNYFFIFFYVRMQKYRKISASLPRRREKREICRTTVCFLPEHRAVLRRIPQLTPPEKPTAETSVKENLRLFRLRYPTSL